MNAYQYYALVSSKTIFDGVLFRLHAEYNWFETEEERADFLKGVDKRHIVELGEQVRTEILLEAVKGFKSHDRYANDRCTDTDILRIR